MGYVQSLDKGILQNVQQVTGQQEYVVQGRNRLVAGFIHTFTWLAQFGHHGKAWEWHDKSDVADAVAAAAARASGIPCAGHAAAAHHMPIIAAWHVVAAATGSAPL